MSFTVYKSSAGSGKTFTLVSEYLNLVLPEPDNFRHILAITFTNKAANEMKERIIGSLMEIANYREYSDSNAVRLIMKEMADRSHKSLDTIAGNAEQTLKLILHNYSDFAISTIDSFMHRVIRSFAFDLHLPLKFEVEIDQEDILSKVVDILISRVGTEEQLTQILIGFTLSKAGDEKNWNIEKDIRDIANYILKENGYEFIQKIKTLTLEDFSRINVKIKKFIRDFEKSVTDLAYEADRIIKSRDIPVEAFFQGKNGIGGYFEKLKKGRFDKPEPNLHVKNTIDNDKWYAGKSTQAEKEEIDTVKADLIGYYHQIDGLVNTYMAQYILWKEIIKNLYPVALLNEISGIMNEYKSENDIILISEFNKRISEIVLKEPIPFIYERIGEKYRHYLIDEFQDTSVMQWRNLLPLIENSLATNGFNMVVGDGKQAIYRWREGEVEQFVMLPKIYKCPDDPVMTERQNILERNYKGRELRNNYRSAKEIIEFNNDFFKFISAKLPGNFKVIYDDVVQEMNPEKSGGMIQIEFYDKENNELSFSEFNLEKVTSLIRDLKNEGFHFSDIAILCRSNKNANILSRELLLRQIPIISSESLEMSGSIEVRLLIAIMKLIVNRFDLIAQAEAISYLVQKGILQGGIHDQFRKFGIFRNKDIASSEPVDFFKSLRDNGFKLDFLTLSRDTLYGITEELLRVFNLNLKADPYIQFFLDAVFKFSKEKNENLDSFLEWWSNKGYKQSIVIPAGTDAIQVMTIHKAKGLEFPVVIYPFANEKHTKPRNKMWIELYEKNLPELKTTLVNESQALLKTNYSQLYMEENDKLLLDLINLLYVVMTRPTHRLYVYTEMPAGSKDAAESVSGFFKDFLDQKGLWKEDKTNYTWGSKTIAERKKRGHLASFQLTHFHSSRWRNRMMLSLQALKNWDIIEQKNRDWGTIIHTILSRTTNPGDIIALLDSCESEGIISLFEKTEIQKVLSSFISRSEVRRYFETGLTIMSEPEILLPSGKIFRPDRIVFYKNETLVIDFKTGKPDDRHKEQVNFYVSLLKEMAYPNVKGILLYVHEPEPVVFV